MTAKEFYLNRNDIDGIENYMIAYTKEKCKELLEIVAEKAKIKTSGEEAKYFLGIDKDSIFNAVDLDEFIV